MAAIQKSTNNKCWRAYGEKGTLLHYWWEIKLVQPLWRKVWRFLKKLETDCLMTQKSHCWANTLRKPELKETCVPQCSSQHCLQQPGYGSNLDVHQQTNGQESIWYIYTMEYYSAIKKNTFESVLMRWMKLEPIIQSEVSQKEKHQYSILTHIFGIQKDGNDNPIHEIAKEAQI